MCVSFEMLHWSNKHKSSSSSSSSSYTSLLHLAAIIKYIRYNLPRWSLELILHRDNRNTLGNLIKRMIAQNMCCIKHLLTDMPSAGYI